MCTLVLAVDLTDQWELMIASTRDEVRTRRWRPPGAWWPRDFPGVVGGLDVVGGGSWLALSPERRRVAVLLNRTEPTSLDDADARSRGSLPLRATADGAEAIASIDLRMTRPFNLVVAEPGQVVWWRYDGDELSRSPVSPGLHMIASTELDDPRHPRVARWLPEFRSAPLPDPAPEEPAPRGWGRWPELLADAETPAGDASALNVRTFPGRPDYGTVSAALVAISADAAKFEFSDGPPDGGSWKRVV